ncbi:hypothetical protein MASR2M47_43050 [Draconibacterium sp.]|jgi:hypothetical protein
MNIQAKKLELFDLILKTEKFSVLDKISNILKQEVDWRDGLPQDIIESVERGLQQVKAGETVPHEEVVEKYKKWL